MYLQPQSARLTAKAIARMSGYAVYSPRWVVETKTPWVWVDRSDMNPDTRSETGFATEEEAALDCCIKNGLIDNVTYESKEASHATL